MDNTFKVAVRGSIEGKLLGLFAVAALAACGGGGGDDAPAPAPATPSAAEGAYHGTLSVSGSNRPIDLLVLENGEYWLMYGLELGGVRGFMRGDSTVSSNGAFTSSSGKDFGGDPAPAVAINAVYNPTSKTIAGTAGSPGAGASDSLSFNVGPVTGSGYNYNAPATLSTVTGQWTLTSDGETIALNIGANGAFTATGNSGCTFSGNVIPRPSGKNVYNVTLTFGGAPCELQGQSSSGIAFAGVTATRTSLAILVVDSAKQHGAMAFGSR